MSLKSILILAALGAVSAASAVTLASFNYDTYTTNPAGNLGTVDPAATSKATGVGAIAFTTTFENGLNTATSGAQTGSVGSFGGATTGSLAVTGASNNSAGASGVKNNGAANQYVLTAAAGSTLSASQLDLKYRRSGTGANLITLGVSKDGGNFTDYTLNLTSTASSFTSLSIASLGITNAQSIALRFTYNGFTNAGGTVRLDDIVLTGTVQPVQAVPEPSAFAALGLGAFALMKRRKQA